MLVNSKEIFKLSIKNGYAVGAYNINNLEWTKYILEACQEDNAPVILATSESAVKYMGGYNVVYNMVKSLIKDLNITIPVVLHLDHGTSVDSCIKAVDAGFTSVMMDASKDSFEENVRKTLEVIEYAKRKNVSVEAEIGVLDSNMDNFYSNAEEAKNFVIRTGVDSLAPSIGNNHGIYKSVPNIDFELLGSICKACHVPLVLHGASGLDDNKIKTSIFCGVTKININTDIQLAWSQAVRKYLNNNPDVYDPRKIIDSGKQAIKKVVHEKNELFGSKNRAN